MELWSLGRGIVLQTGGVEVGITGAAAALLAVGTLYFAAMGLRSSGPRARLCYLHAAVTTVAAVAYAAMTVGVGAGAVALPLVGTAEVNWVRYLDWLVTTPLLLYSLLAFADASRGVVTAVLGADAAMIVVGFFASASFQAGLLANLGLSIGLFTVSVLLWAMVLYQTFVGLGNPADDDDPFTTLRNVLVALWSVYPVVWVLAMTGALGFVGETGAYAVLDVTAKVAFGVLAVRLAADADVGRPAASPTGADAEAGAR